jgi:cathepsin L
MMSRVPLLLLACVAVMAASHPAYLAESQYEMLFTKWMVQHGKTYEIEEFFERYGIFKSNLNYIHAHNTFSNYTYTMGMNQFGDLTQAEFKNYVGLRPFPIESENATVFRVGTATDRPKVDPTNRLHVTGQDSADWRLRPNVVTPVKNQGQCGSCYAFGSVAAVEGWNGIHGGSGQLAEQQIVDCSTSYGNNGCGAGWAVRSIDYMKASGIAFSQNYPYVARQQPCQNVATKVRPPGYRSVNGEPGIIDLVMSGPTVVTIAADAKVFQFYHSGVINSPDCGSNLDHSVTVVGYTVNSYIIKNSWGATWGNAGYVEIARNSNNMCGIGRGTGGSASTVVG